MILFGAGDFFGVVIFLWGGVLGGGGDFFDSITKSLVPKSLVPKSLVPKSLVDKKSSVTVQ